MAPPHVTKMLLRTPDPLPLFGRVWERDQWVTVVGTECGIEVQMSNLHTHPH